MFLSKGWERKQVEHIFTYSHIFSHGDVLCTFTSYGATLAFIVFQLSPKDVLI